MDIAGSWSARRIRRSRTSGAWWDRAGIWSIGRALRRNANLTEITGAPGQTLASASADDPASAHTYNLPSFEAFFRQHERDIFGYLWRITGDEQAAYDLSQETFMRAWQHFDRIATYERPGGWLFRVATNLALTHQKRAAAPVGAAQPFATGNEPSVSDPAWRLAESEAILATLLALPPQQRAALALREVYGFSCAEVAEALGITLAAAKMTLSRGRDAFRARYTREEQRS
ncbi:MAG TPA: RNA polymerase sigma factor [Ktedonobacterales bacterium]|nr:RNA polymerase sigma factor [Ktedonobacterales bacterium]